MPLLVRIDELLRDDHCNLSSDDECYALREYTSGKGFSFGETNSLISNLKKTLDKKGAPGWSYKDKAIRQVAAELRTTLKPEILSGIVVVPMPPSKTRAHALYDDRMLQVAKLACGPNGHARELLYRTVDTEASHQSDERRDPDEMARTLAIDERFTNPPPGLIAVLDDLLTTGAHFVAAKRVLRRRFQGATVIGLFIARRVFPDPS